MNRCCWKNPPFFCLNYRRYLTIGVTSVSALLRYRRYLSLSGYGSLLVKDPTNSFVRTIGVIPISAILNYRRHLHKMALTRLDLIMKSWECLLANSPEIIESAITNYRRYSIIGVTQLSASLTKNGVYMLGLNPGIDRIFLKKLSAN